MTRYAMTTRNDSLGREAARMIAARALTVYTDTTTADVRRGDTMVVRDVQRCENGGLIVRLVSERDLREVATILLVD